ncbi:hypothetical protein [Oceanobacillus jeddahense]|uniref:hypothetical protein n=1 Tax=Oceanobacillus jeddahense TaxID=1462527 RepID=UPI0005958677|nr:hypothetical protein [Oceanobacillus jeddahense]
MKRNLIPIYRNQDLYTLFYDQNEKVIYKIPFWKKNSISSVYLIVIALYIIGFLLNGFYQNYSNVLLDIILLILGIGIAYVTVDKIYQIYYEYEKKHPIILDFSYLEECIYKGMKQSRIEIVVIVLSFLFAIVAFALFFIANSIEPLIIGCLSTTVFLSFIYMKPFKRRKVIKEWSKKR